MLNTSYFWRKLQLPTNNIKPTERYGHTASLVGSKLYIYAGWKRKDSASFSDLWALDLRTMRWEEPITTGIQPMPRGGHSAEVIGSEIWFFGGQSKHDIFNDVNVFDTESLTWSKQVIHGPCPAPRSQHVSFTLGTNMFILLGHDGFGRMFNDLWMLNTVTLTWTRLTTDGTVEPPAVGGATATLVNNSMLYVFGGRFDPNRYSDALYILDIENLTWHQPETRGLSPSARAAHSSTILGNELHVIGGSNGKERLGDLFTLDLETLVWTRPMIAGNALCPHSVHSATLINDCIVVYGGFDGNECFSDVYALCNGRNSNITTTIFTTTKNMTTITETPPTLLLR